MNRRQFLSLVTAGVTMVPWQVSWATPNTKTRLVVADQSELLRHLLLASGEGAALPFDLQLPNFAGGPAIFEAMRAGALDLAYVGDTPPIQARAAGVLLPIIATFTREKAQYRLVQRDGAGVEHLTDLAGKRVSYIEGSGRQVFLIEALNKVGLTLEDVELVPLRVAELNDALRAGAVDVAIITEPHITRLGQQVKVRVVPDPLEREILPSTSYIYARPEVLLDSEKAEAIALFIAAFVRAGLWSNLNQDAWGEHYYRSFQRLDAESTAVTLAAQSPLVFQTAVEAQPHHQKLMDVLYSTGALAQPLRAEDSFVSTYDAVITANR